jgi:alkylation response protein AidB-like acyl-CoA dehydrogenase
MNDAVLTGPVSGLDASGAACLARAEALIPVLRAAAPKIDAANELTTDVLDALHDGGMFRLLLPKTFGGFELTPSEYVRCVEAIARGDASAAWCMNQGSGCAMTAAYLAPDVSRDIWGARRDVLAWGQGPGARAVRAEGGWRVTGTYTFVSGIRHATWVGAHCPCFDPDGTPVRAPDGRHWERTMLIPASRVRIEGDWRVLGLRGTGSDRFTVTDFFVDDAHSVTRESPAERREAGTLYRFQAMQIYAAGFACVGLGTARAALDDFIALVRTKTQAWSSTPLREDQAVARVIGEADSALKMARGGLLRTLEDAWDDVARAGELSLAAKVAIRQASTFAIHAARDVVHDIYHEAGATAIWDDQPFERRLRDVNTVSQQTQGRRTHFETVGRYLLGQEMDKRWL